MSTDQILGPFQTFNNLVPEKGGPLAITKDFDFSSVVTISFDLSVLQSQNPYMFVQSILVDNSQNAQPLLIVTEVIAQTLRIPAGAQAILPLLVGKPTKIDFATTGALIIPITFLNVALPALVWGESGNVVTDLALILAQLQLLTADIFSNVVTDRSGTITLGGTSQQLVAANASRKRLLLQNDYSETTDLWINFGATAASTGGDSIELVPGGTYDTGGGPCWRGAIQIIGSNTGHKFACKEYT